MSTLPNNLIWHEGAPPRIDAANDKELRPFLVEYSDGAVQSYGQGNYAGGFCDCCRDGYRFDDAVSMGLGLGMSARDQGRARRRFEHERRIVASLRGCPGRMANGPDKNFTRCDRCGRIDYEKNEGDLCLAK